MVNLDELMEQVAGKGKSEEQKTRTRERTTIANATPTGPSAVTTEIQGETKNIRWVANFYTFDEEAEAKAVAQASAQHYYWRPRATAEHGIEELEALRIEGIWEEQWGGEREGAGRKPLAEADPTEAHSVTMPASYWQRIKEIGDGQYSAGVRKLVEGHSPE